MRVANHFSKLTLGLAALAMMLGLSTAAISLADDAPATSTAPAAATGTISGKVLDAAGNPAKGVAVEAVAGDAKGKKAPALATATTGDDGTYKLENVPAGSVKVGAKLDATTGKVKGTVTVTAGQDTKADDITLAAGKAKGKKAAANN